MSGPRILVVEDNPTARKLFRITLQAEGYDVIEAGDAQTAIASLNRDAPALVLQDLLLPDMNGLDLLKKLRELPTGRAIPIVAVSGFRRILEQASVLPHGFDATLVKPVNRADLLATVHSLLPAPREPASVSVRGRRVLLVDDDPVQLKLVRLRLLDAGYEVTTADDGATARGLAVTNPPDVVLSDVLMDGMDGFELCAAVRSEPTLGGVPVVLMSAHYVEAHDDALAARVGAVSLARRTPHLREVLGALQEALATSQPAPPLTKTTFPHAEHTLRLAHRLKQVASANSALVTRCAQQAAQLSIVGGVAQAIARSENVDAAIEDVLSACLDAGGISRGALFRENASGLLYPYQCVGFTREQQAALEAAIRHFSIRALADTAGLISLATLLPPAELEALLVAASMTSGVFVPISADGHCHAALLLACSAAEVDDEELMTFGRAVGASVGQALTLSAAFNRLSAAAETDRILFSRLEIHTTLRSLGDLVIARLGDLCAIDLVEDDGRLRQVALVHSDPATLEVLQDLGRRYPPLPGSSRTYSVLSTQTPYLSGEITEAARDAEARDEEHLRLLRKVGLRSEMIVPMVFQGRTLGIMTIGTSRSGRRHGPLDLALAAEIAGRAAIAIRNAQLYEGMQQASRTKDEFLAVVSHELRTPLNAMLGWTRLLRGGSLHPEKHARALESVERNGVAQAQLIEDILDISRIVSGKLQFKLQDTLIQKVVEGAVDSVRPGLDAKAIRLEVDLGPDVVISCDAERLQQVLWNLLSNAIKFTPRGGRIELSIEPTDSAVQLSIQDSGQGIRPELLPRVFERFQQGDEGYTRLHGGLGLGLAIARHIVELHSGTIEARSDGEGKGTLLRVTLPRSAGRVSSIPGPQRRAATEMEVPPELVGLRVLVIDDDDAAREIFAEVLGGCGASVTAASSARQALKVLAEARHDVIVSDIGMPGEDGYWFIRALRALTPEAGGATPAIAVTAFARAEERGAALAAGFHMHLSKPYEPAELLASIATLARISKLVS